MYKKYIDQLSLARSQLGTWPMTQACALTGNRTGDPLVHRPALNPVIQGWIFWLLLSCEWGIPWWLLSLVMWTWAVSIWPRCGVTAVSIHNKTTHIPRPHHGSFEVQFSFSWFGMLGEQSNNKIRCCSTARGPRNAVVFRLCHCDYNSAQIICHAQGLWRPMAWLCSKRPNGHCNLNFIEFLQVMGCHSSDFFLSKQFRM